MRYTEETPRQEAIGIAIGAIDLAIKLHTEEAESRRDRTVVRQLKKLSHQLRRKIGADSVYPDVE